MFFSFLQKNKKNFTFLRFYATIIKDYFPKGPTFLRFYKFLSTKQEKEFFLLGYPLRLSPEEAALLRYIQKRRTLGVRITPNVSKNALAVRVCSINKKAMRVSGRKLIVFIDGAYRLNPYL